MAEEKQKLLFVVEAMGGGVFTYIVELANELINDYEVYIAYGLRKQTPSNYPEYFDRRIKLIKVDNFVRPINPIKDIKAFKEIRKIANEVQPHLIHLHSSKAGVLGRWAFDGKRVPLFYTPHGYSFLMSNQSVVKRLIYKLIEIVCALRKCMTISCSEGEYLETLHLTRNATYVNNGINIAQMQEIIKGLPEITKSSFTVATLGRICYQKNPKLFNKIAEKMPDIRFVWIGDGELRNELVSSNIDVTGWCDREQALQKLSECDVFVLTSLWEGLPMSLLEAMYMKKLCLVTNVIGNRDVIRTRENGFVCSNADEFIESIMMAEETNVSLMIENAYSDIFTLYNTKEMGRRYSKIYRNTLDCKAMNEGRRCERY